jgi:hypothetical protein
MTYEMPQLPSWSQKNDVDAKLQALVASAENSASGTFSFPITLVTAGGLVSGQLVPHAAWAEQMQLLGAEAEGGLPEATRVVAEPFALAHEFDLEDEEFDRIHLIDTVLMFGAGAHPGGVAWRGRLKDVVGWSFGKLDLPE